MLNKANTAFVVCPVCGGRGVCGTNTFAAPADTEAVSCGGDVHTDVQRGEMSTKRRCPQTAGFRCVLLHTAQEIKEIHGNTRKCTEMQNKE